MNYLKNELYNLVKKDSSIFEFLVSGSLDGVWYWDLENPENEWMSPQFWTTLGYDPEEKKHLASEWQDLICPADLQVALDNLRRHCADPNHPYDQIVRYRHKDGSTVWVRCQGIAIRDDDGNPIRMLGTHNDLTKEKRAEEELRSERSRLKAIFDTIPAVIDIVDPNTHDILFMNQYTIDLYGADGTGKKCYEVFHNFQSACSFCNNKQLIREGLDEIIRWEYFSETLNRFFMTTNRLFRWNDGRMVKLELSIDVTELKRAQAEQEKLRAGLQQAQKMESIGCLAGGIAHDFNNILFPIVGLSEMLVEDLPPDSLQHRNASGILKAGKRGSDLVKQILAFSRQTEQRKQPLKIQSILKEVMSLARSAIPSTVTITCNVQKDCGMMIADPTQLHQIAMNLITNAYHAVEEKEDPEILIELTETDLSAEAVYRLSIAPGTYAKLTVSDNGCGMHPELMEKIYEPYFTTKEQGKGTGLGLAVVYGIVKEHHGDVAVQSEMGNGTTFTVYLPLMARSADMVAPDKTGASLEAGHEAILLVDDEEPVATLEKQLLERLGYRVTEKFSSAEALEAFRSDPGAYDLVITDMAMPGMTGDRLAEEIHSIRPDMPLIVCTGFDETMDEAKAVEIGIRGFLMKPVLKAEMAKMVRQVIDEAEEPIQEI